MDKGLRRQGRDAGRVLWVACLVVLVAAGTGCERVSERIQFRRDGSATITIEFDMDEAELSDYEKLGLPLTRRHAQQILALQGVTLKEFEAPRGEDGRVLVKIVGVVSPDAPPVGSEPPIRVTGLGAGRFQFVRNYHLEQPEGLSPARMEMLRGIDYDATVEIPGGVVNAEGGMTEQVVGGRKTTLSGKFTVVELMESTVTCTAELRILGGQTPPEPIAVFVLCVSIVGVVASFIYSLATAHRELGRKDRIEGGR